MILIQYNNCRKGGPSLLEKGYVRIRILTQNLSPNCSQRTFFCHGLRLAGLLAGSWHCLLLLLHSRQLVQIRLSAGRPWQFI